MSQLDFSVRKHFLWFGNYFVFGQTGLIKFHFKSCVYFCSARKFLSKHFKKHFVSKNRHIDFNHWFRCKKQSKFGNHLNGALNEAPSNFKIICRISIAKWKNWWSTSPKIAKPSYEYRCNRAAHLSVTQDQTKCSSLNTSHLLRVSSSSLPHSAHFRFSAALFYLCKIKWELVSYAILASATTASHNHNTYYSNKFIGKKNFSFFVIICVLFRWLLFVQFFVFCPAIAGP